MKTLGDVLEKMQEVNLRVELFMVSGVFIGTYNQQKEAIGEAIWKENGIGPHGHGVIGCLPLETKLGPESLRLFGELCAWLDTQ